MDKQGTDTKQTVLFICCAANELFFIALYLLAFSSPLISPALLQPTPGSFQPGNPAAPKPSMLASPWSAAAMEMARWVELIYVIVFDRD